MDWQYEWLLNKAKAIPNELRPKYEKGTYPEGSAKIISNAIQKAWMTCRKSKQIPLDKQISGIIKENGILFLKCQTMKIPIRVKTIDKLDDALLNRYNSAVIWLKAKKWIADIQIEVDNKYNEAKPEAVIGIDLNKEHTTYSIWADGIEIYKAYDRTGLMRNAMRRIENRIAFKQQNFRGSRKRLSNILHPLHDARKRILRQYYGTLRGKILQHIPETHNAVFIVENLEDLPRAKLRKIQRKWSHQELANGILADGIVWHGYKLIKVDPRGTTHTCWKCGMKVYDTANRTIICSRCYPKGIDRDLNAARNIAFRYMLKANPQHSCSGKPQANDPSQLYTEAVMQTNPQTKMEV